MNKLILMCTTFCMALSFTACKKTPTDDGTSNNTTTPQAERLQLIQGGWKLTANAFDENNNGLIDEAEKEFPSSSDQLIINFLADGTGGIEDANLAKKISWKMYNDYKEMGIKVDDEEDTSYFFISLLNKEEFVLQSEDSLGLFNEQDKSWILLQKQ